MSTTEKFKDYLEVTFPSEGKDPGMLLFTESMQVGLSTIS